MTTAFKSHAKGFPPAGVPVVPFPGANMSSSDRGADELPPLRMLTRHVRTWKYPVDSPRAPNRQGDSSPAETETATDVDANPTKLPAG